MAVGVRSGRSEQLEALVWGVMGNIAIHVFHHQEEFLAVEGQPQSVCRVEEAHSSPFFWKKSLLGFFHQGFLAFLLPPWPSRFSLISVTENIGGSTGIRPRPTFCLSPCRILPQGDHTHSHSYHYCLQQHRCSLCLSLELRVLPAWPVGCLTILLWCQNHSIHRALYPSLTAFPVWQ